MMKSDAIKLPRKEEQYFLDIPKKPEVKYFPKSEKLFMLCCTTRRLDSYRIGQ